MGRTLQRVLIAFATIVGVPLVGLATYDAFVVRPRLDEVHAMLREADPLDRAPPRNVVALIEASSSNAPEAHVTRLVVGRVMPARTQLGWHARGMLWRLLLPMHLEHDEMIGLYASQSWNGIDHGLNKLAQRRYGKSLDALSAQEAAQVVAMLWGPGYLEKRPEALEKRAQLLLQRASL